MSDQGRTQRLIRIAGYVALAAVAVLLSVELLWAQVPCDQSPFPTCDGDCPPGTHCEPPPPGAVVLPNSQLPPEPEPRDCDGVVSQYEGKSVHALFPNGVDFSNPIHKCFQNVQRQDDGQGNEIEIFNSTMEGTADVGQGPMPVTLTGPVTTLVFGKTGNTAGTFQTEMVSMSLTGNVGGIPVEIRENPDLPSPGETTITDLGGGLYQIDSFFDVFTEISVAGGPFQPQSNGPGRVTLVRSNPDPCQCVNDPPCDQSDPLTCGGACPDLNDTCTIDPAGGPCFCEPPVVGGPCSQCGPGPHFIDACGPFPPIGTDLVANNGAVIGIDLDFDCVRDLNVVLRPCPPPDDLLNVHKILGPIDDSANFPGTSPVDGHPTGPGLDVIDTEIFAMCLTDGVVTMVAGVAGPSALQLPRTLGTVAEDLSTPDPSWADSRFNVWFEVSGIPGGPVYNQAPLQVNSRIDCLPPAANYHHPTGICLPLTTAGFCIGGPSDGTVCVNDQDCPGGACGGTTLVANLVSANHSVNQDVCQASPFPQCGGDCPAGEACKASPDSCECVPVPCDQSGPVTCGGDCPPGDVCTPDAAGGPCSCQPLPVLCEQSDPLICGGTCTDPDLVCTLDPAGGPCFCAPPPEPCETSDPLTCGGVCTDPNDVCTPGPAGTPCFCAPPCDLSDPLTCGGVCTNPNDTCTIDIVTGRCFCEPPPVACDLSDPLSCGGVCPDPIDVCETDPAGGACLCVPSAVGDPCSQCGPGPHFIDACGPFPPTGTDLVANNGAVVGIDLDGDCIRDLNAVLRPCGAPNDRLRVDKTLGPIDDSANFPGTSPVDTHPSGPGLDVIDTEIVALCLTDGFVTLAAGAGGPSALPLQPSLGTVAEDLATPDPSQADSRFDVFFEVSGIPGGPAYNQVPLAVQSRIDCLPPAANYHHPTGICVPLTAAGSCTGGPADGSACVSDLDCRPFGACTGTTFVANLVSANHSVNQDVCQNSPFPQCGGDCPAGEVCAPTGAVGCDCIPLTCELSDPLTCGGPCPNPTDICTLDAAGNSCFCAPPPCDQSDPATCGGTCPNPTDICTLDAAGTACFCEPLPVACDLSDPLTCGGVCPDPDDICETDPAGGRCLCVPSAVGDPCSQCGPGPHFIDACGPFPPTGTDLVANNGAVVGIDTNFDCIRDINLVMRPCPAPNDRLRVDKTLGPIDDSANFPGTSPVDGHPTGPGLDVIDTEIVSMCLTGGGFILAAGTGGPSALPLQPSLGTVAEDLSTPDPSLADSRFDVLFEVSGIPGGPVYNQVPLPVRGRINCLPPAANYSHPTGICLPLTTAGTCVGGANDGNACINDLDCPGGACGGTTVLANLVSANHSVNQDVCQDSPFPVCGGDCPAGELCTPNAATGACFCAPEPEPCEQSDPATCGGVCTGTNQVCSIGPAGLCECIPDTFAGGAVPDGAIVPGIPLTLQRTTTEAAGDITLTWGASCSPADDDYEIYEGLIPGFYNHTSRFCSTGGATTITFTPIAGDTYYLVVPRNPLREGSYGIDSAGAERPQGGLACLPQLIGACP